MIMPIDKSFMQSLDFGRGIVAFNTTRGYDVDMNNPYAGFNACHYIDDEIAHVKHCRQSLCEYLNIPNCNLIIPRQTHSLNVAVIDTVPCDILNLNDIDALVTNQRRVALAVNTADCVPILLADMKNKVVAAVHSGWRGTIGHIICKTINKMIEIGADVKNIKAMIAPCICVDCFEVGNEVSSIFEKEYPEMDVVVKTSYKNHVDLVKACYIDMMKIGIEAHNVTMPIDCTRCNPHKYFSARHYGIKSGRMLSLIMLQ